MKAIKIAAPILAAMLVIAGGLYIPQFVSTAYDYHLSTQVKEMENNDISLDFSKKSSDYFQRAYEFNRVFAQGYGTILDTGGTFNMTSDEVEKNVKDMIKAMGIGINKEKSFKVIPYVSVYSDGFIDVSSSAQEISGEKKDIVQNEQPDRQTVDTYVYWACIWNSSYWGEQAVYIDDETGLPLGFVFDFPIFFNDKEQEKLDTDGTDYSFDSITQYLQKNAAPDNVELDFSNDKGVWFIIVEKDNQKYSYSVYIDGGEKIFFNLM